VKSALDVFENHFGRKADLVALILPEDLALFRRYLDPGTKSAV